MIKRYDDHYIDLEAVIAVTAIDDSYYDGLGERFSFQVFLIGGAALSFKNNNKDRLLALRADLVRDWLLVKSSQSDVRTK